MKSPRLLAAIDILSTHKFSAASIAKADRRHPGVPIRAMVDEAKTLALELKETVSEIAKTIDDEDPQINVIQQILRCLGEEGAETGPRPGGARVNPRKRTKKHASFPSRPVA